MAQATIDSELALQYVTAITDSMNKITEACQVHKQVLTDLAEKTNINPIIKLDQAFQAMSQACTRAAENLTECLDKTRKYCEEADIINTEEGNLFMD